MYIFFSVSNVNQQNQYFLNRKVKSSLKDIQESSCTTHRKNQLLKIIRHLRENLSYKYQEQACHKYNRKCWLSALHRLKSSQIKLEF